MLASDRPVPTRRGVRPHSRQSAAKRSPSGERAGGRVAPLSNSGLAVPSQGCRAWRLLRSATRTTPMTLLEFIVYLIIAGVCGAIARGLGGGTTGGFVVSILVGFLGAFL